MAVKASTTITLYYLVDIVSTTVYYLLQPSTSSPPSKPTTDNPGGNWTTSEPTYSEGSTNTLYTVTKFKYSRNLPDKTVDFEYTPVSKSTSYEAAKAAYNKAVNANNNANTALENVTNLEVGVGNLWFNYQRPKADTTQWTANPIETITTDLPESNESTFALRGGLTTKYYVPFSKSKTYKIYAWLKTHSSQASSTSNYYPSIYPYDMDKQMINYTDVITMSASTTTLSQDLNTGDTIVHLTSVSGFPTGTANKNYYIGIFNYKSSTGYSYETYTKHVYKFAANTDVLSNIINTTNKTVTLKSAYSGSTIPAGTKISCTQDGSTYIYPFGGMTLKSTANWIYKENIFNYNFDVRLKETSYIRFNTYNNNVFYYGLALKDYSESFKGTEIIVGTQTATTGAWTGNASFGKLINGQQIAYWLPYAGSGNASLNLTLSDGSTTGAIACYYSGTTRITTHYAAGNIIHLTYRVNANINGSSYTGWWADANYVDGNTYDRIRFNNIIKVKSAITAGQIIVSDSDGYFKLIAGSVFNLDKPILYCGTTKTAGATDSTNNYLSMPSVNVRNNTNSGWTATKDLTLYLVGIISNNIFTVDSTTPFTTTIPTTKDNKYYISLGYMYSTYQLYLYPEHPIFAYTNDGFKNISQIAYEAQDNVDKARTDLSGEIDTKTKYVQNNLDNLNDHLDDKVLDMIRNIDSTGFVLTTSQPSDWTTKYTNYYVYDGQNNKYVRLEESETPPTWQANKYYKNSNTLSQAMFNINDTRFDFKWSDQATQDELRQSVNTLLNEKHIDNLQYISADQGVLWFGNAQSKYKLAIDNDGIDILYNNIIQSFWNTERFDTAGLAMGNRDGVWKEFVENAYKIANGFTKTTSQPSNWSTTYTNYYVKADVSGKWCTKVTGSSAPTWAADMYYSYSGTPTITGKRYRIWRFMYVPNSNGSLSFRRVETFSIEEVTS